LRRETRDRGSRGSTLEIGWGEEGGARRGGEGGRDGVRVGNGEGHKVEGSTRENKEGGEGGVWGGGRGLGGGKG